MEQIEAAAVKTQDGTVYAVARPGRHPDVRDFMLNELGLDRFQFIRAQQGFITDRGRFVDRREGLRIALERQQIVHKHPYEGYSLLFSEDMW